PPPPPAPPPPPPPPDKVAPTVHAYAVSARRGTLVKLRYRVRDDDGETSEQISIYRRSTVLRAFRRALRATDDFTAYWITWRAPKRPASLRFCVRATDAAGNRSALSCAPLRIL
ncbi:MAG: hypothetical protein WBB74_04235, partial [Gaiellaceae bacterium]